MRSLSRLPVSLVRRMAAPQTDTWRLRRSACPCGRRPFVIRSKASVRAGRDRKVREMANYVFAYSGGKGVAADEAERDAQMARWGQWFGELGSAVVDGGAAMGTAKNGRPGRLGQRWRLAWPDRLLDRVSRQPRFGGRARQGLPGPRGRRRSRRLRSDRDVAGERGAGSASISGPEPDPALLAIYGPGRTRTCDPLLRRQPLCPAELRGPGAEA